VAAYQYYIKTADQNFVSQILPVLTDIIKWHYNGTRYNIKVDPEDQLLAGGEEGVQLTWMDAKVGDWVVTPRKGKAVEINALWYNALCIFAKFLAEDGQEAQAEVYRYKARKVIKSFNNLFWNEGRGCLYDFVDGAIRNGAIRPNQIFAVSLPFTLLSKDRARKVLEVVTKTLLTPQGLRSLAPGHEDYKPYYIGDIWARDGAYHQGTVWGFLIGPYVDALIKVKGVKASKEAAAIVTAFLKQMDLAGVGSISEIFDAEAPHVPRGCIAQAWSISEALRVVTQYDLVSNSNNKKSPAR
jgi:predicted glycogen debranching enzyme